MGTRDPQDLKVSEPAINSFLNIQVRVAAQQALQMMKQMQGQLAATRQQVAALQKQQSAAAAVSSSAGGNAGIGSPRSTQNLAKWGNQLQWTGRQLQYNFTLPVLLAAGAATKFQLDNEQAFTQVSKVYGDTQAAAAQFRREQKGLTQEMAEQQATKVFQDELNALSDAFEALSGKYGVQQKAVMEVAGAWAAAGASGVDLAKSTELSLQAVILGNMDAAKATEALIAIQAQYSLSTDQLSETLAVLNAVENQTGISMQGLIEGFSRSAGVAREAGVDVRHLAAMLAAMTPAAGSASQAGNALKTIISRLMSPTQEASQVMHEMGLNIDSMQWQSATATERLLIMAKSFQGLSDSQKQVASSVIASRWQINKFNVLMRELNSNTGFYQKALDATTNRGKVFTQMQKELNTVLASNPKRLEQIWYTLQNAAADIIQPLLPYLIYLANEIKDLVVAFSNLNPHLQKFVLLAAVILVVVGPLVRYIGSTATLIYELGRGFGWILKPFAAVAGLFGLFTRNLRGANKTAASTPGIFSKAGAAIKAAFGSSSIFGFLAIGAGVAKQIFSFNYQVAKYVLIDSIVKAAKTAGPALLKVLSAMLSAPIRMAVAQAMLNLGALVGLFSMVFRRIGATILRSGIADAVGAVILWVMRLGTVTGPLTGIWARAGMAWQRIWGAMYFAFMTTFGVLPRIVATTAAGVTAIWQMLGARMLVIHAATQAKLIGITAAFEAKMLGLFGRIRTGVLAIWMSMNSRMLAMFVATQIALMSAPARFLGFLRGLPGRAASIGKDLGARFITFLPVMLGALRTVGPQVIKFMVGPWGLAIGAIIALAYRFREQIATIWNNIVEYFGNSNNGLVKGIIGAWNLLPQGVANALTAVARVVRDIALKIYELFSYINPFAHHSPSLVENVTRGMALVRNEFAKAGNVGSLLRGAYADINAFGRAVGKLVGGVDSLKHADDRASIAKFVPKALGAFDQLQRRLTSLNSVLATMKSQVAAQQGVVDSWTAAVERANKALDGQQARLDALQKIADGYSASLDAAKQRLQDYADAPLRGMGAMEDRIFANEMAQKRLRLEMMKMEDAVGPLEDVKSKIDAINGAQELLRGKQAELRAAGAGSEILSVYDKEIGKLEKQKDVFAEQGDKVQKLQDQLDALQRQAERMDLEKALRFDPLRRQIDAAANSVKELSFEDIMSGIKSSQADVKLYTDRLAGVNAAIDQQKKAVEAATVARDAAQQRLDAEQKSLEAIKDRYSEVEDAIRGVEEAMNTAVSAADEMNRRLEEAKRKKKEAEEYISPGLANFRAAEGGNFADVGGVGVPKRTDWSSQEAEIKKFTEGLSQQVADAFKNLNPFAGIKTKVLEFKTWLGQVWDSIWGGVRDAYAHIFDGVDFGGAKDKASGFLSGVRNIFNKGVDAVKKVWALLGPDIILFFKELWKGIQDVWKQIAPEVAKFGDLIKPALEALKNTAVPVLAVVAGIVLFLAKVLLSVLANTIRPFLSAVGGILTGLVRVIRGIVQIIIGIFTLDLGMIIQGVGNIFAGLFKVAWSILSGGVQIIWGIIKGLVKGIWGFFKWLWDVLVGHSVIPDIVNGIVGWIKKLIGIPKWVYDNVIKPAYEAWVDFWSGLNKKIGDWAGYIKTNVENLFKSVKKKIDDKISDIKTGWNFLWDYINKKIGDWAKYIKTNVSNLVSAVKKFFDDKIRDVKLGWTTFWSVINSKIGEWATYIKQNVSNLLASVKKFFEDKIADVKLGWTTFWSWINGKIGGWGTYIRKNVSNLLENIKNIFSGAVTAIGKIWDKVQEKIQGPINAIKNWINANLVDPLNKVVKLFGVTIPKLATGGKVGGAFGETGAGHTPTKLATGGPIPGWSPHSKADNIPLWATAGEFMQPVASVRYYGPGFMEAIRTRSIPKEALGLANGGPVTHQGAKGYFLGGLIDGALKKVDSWLSKGASYALDQIMNPAISQIGNAFKSPEFANKVATGSLRKIRDSIKTWIGIQEKRGGTAGNMPTNPGLGGALAWARTQIGKPYLWGGVGPAGYDCSGFMSAITNYIQGRPLYQRLFATGSLPAMFQKGPGAFSLAWFKGNPGHTAGTLNGVNVESRGGRGVLVGPAARGATDSLFNSGVYHLPGYYKGGLIPKGDPPFDLVSPRGKYYIPGPTELNTIMGLRNGAIVRGGSGGTLVQVGEGTRDEIVAPLPSGWSPDEKSGDTIINVNGNLEFPNITDGDDVEELVEGLKILAGDYE